MLRLLIAAGLAALVGTNPQQKSGDPAKPDEQCRIAATALRTRNTGPGVAMETVTACSVDRMVRKTTCTTRFKDTRGIPTTSISITSFASLDDLVDETTVVPPLRRSTRYGHDNEDQLEFDEVEYCECTMRRSGWCGR